MIGGQEYEVYWLVYVFFAFVAYFVVGFLLALFKTRGENVSGTEFWGIALTSPAAIVVGLIFLGLLVSLL